MAFATTASGSPQPSWCPETDCASLRGGAWVAQGVSIQNKLWNWGRTTGSKAMNSITNSWCFRNPPLIHREVYSLLHSLKGFKYPSSKAHYKFNFFCLWRNAKARQHGAKPQQPNSFASKIESILQKHHNKTVEQINIWLSQQTS